MSALLIALLVVACIAAYIGLCALAAYLLGKAGCDDAEIAVPLVAVAPLGILLAVAALAWDAGLRGRR